MRKLLALALIAAFAVFAWSLLPAPHEGQAGSTAEATTEAKVLPQRTETGRGVVQHVDRARSIVTIKHGPLPALKMMPMTMSYPVRDPGQLASLQPMQEVEFQVSYDGADYLITDIR